MSRYRGKGSGTPYTSQADVDLLLMLYKGYDSGELLEQPQTMDGDGAPIRIFFVSKNVDPKSLPRGFIAFTRPDINFPVARKVVYLDGPHHLRAVHYRRDLEIDLKLRELGFEPMRFPYERMTRTLLGEIYGVIVEAVNVEVRKFNGLMVEALKYRK